MAEVKDILQEYVATANNPQYKSDWNIINSKFPELKGYDAKLLQEYVATANNPQYKSNFQTINSKFPELFSQQQQAIQPKQTTTNGIGVLKKQLPFKAVTDFQQSIVDLAVPNKNTENNPIIGIGTPMEKKKQEPKLEMVYSATEKQLVPKYTEAPKTSVYDVANAMSTEQLLSANNDVFKGVVGQANGDTGLDEFNQQSDKNNNIQAFNRESELYNVRVKTLKERAGNLERVLASKYQTPDFMQQVKSQMATVKQKSAQYDAYVQSRSKEVIALQTELEAIVEQGKTGAQPIEVLKPAYDAKKAQLDAIQRDDEQKRGEIEQLQNDFNGKLDDPDFALYSQIYDKINELSGEQQGLISKPEFAEYRKLLDEGDKAQAKKDAMKKAYQSKGILGKAVDIYTGIGMATNPAAYFLDNGEQVDKTFIGAKIADEGDKLLGRTLKALASVPKMLDISNPIGDENKYDVFDEMFDQAIYASKKRDILNPTATDVQRDIIQKYADVDGYRVMLDENGKPTNDVRDASFYKVNDKTQKEITDKYNENPKAYKTESDFSFSTLTTKATPTILDMGTMMATAALTGGTTGLVAGAGTAGTVSTATTVGVSAAQMYGDMYESGLNAGLTPQEANDFATLTSIMTGMVTLVNPMEANIVKGTASKSIGKFISNSISKADVQLIRSGEMSIGQYVKRMAKEGVKNTFGENLEELVLEPAVQRAIETYYNTKAQKNGQQGFEDLNKPFFDTKQTIETAMITTMASLLMTPIEVANSVPEQRKIALQNALDNPQAFIDLRNSMLNSGDVSQEKFDYEVKAFEEISKQYNTVKPNIKEDLHDDLAELLLKKYTLKNTMSQVNDEVLNKKNQLLLDDINKRLEEVADGTYNKGKEKVLSNIANPNTLIEEDKVATYNGAEVTILDDLADGEVVINTNNPEIGEDGIITVEKSALTDVRNKPKDIEQLQITSAVININGKEYEGKNHAEAILKAQADGQDISQVDRQAEGLFKLSDGTIINREQAKEQFGQDRSELIIPQDEASNQANVEYKRIQDEQANTITPTEPINAGQELNNGAGIQQVNGNGGEIQQGSRIGQVSGQEVPTEKVEEKVKPIRQLGTGSNVYFETPKYRVNDFKDGKVLLNINGEEDGGMAIANIEFDNVNEAVKVAERLQQDFPNGIPDDIRAEKYVEATRESLNRENINAQPEVSKPVSEIAKTPISKTETTAILDEIKSKNLTHVKGKNMGENQALGTFISTEKGNRYETPTQKAEQVEIDIQNPFVVDNGDFGLVDKRQEILNANRDKFTEFDTVDYQKLPAGKLTVDNLNDAGIKKLAELTTNELKSQGYDGIYFRESDTQEGELVVFDKEKVRFKGEENQQDLPNDRKAKEDKIVQLTKSHNNTGRKSPADKQTRVSLKSEIQALAKELGWSIKPRSNGYNFDIIDEKGVQKREKTFLTTEQKKQQKEASAEEKKWIKKIIDFEFYDIADRVLQYIATGGRIHTDDLLEQAIGKGNNTEYRKKQGMHSKSAPRIDNMIEGLLGVMASDKEQTDARNAIIEGFRKYTKASAQAELIPKIEQEEIANDGKPLTEEELADFEKFKKEQLQNEQDKIALAEKPLSEQDADLVNDIYNLDLSDKQADVMSEFINKFKDENGNIDWDSAIDALGDDFSLDLMSLPDEKIKQTIKIIEDAKSKREKQNESPIGKNPNGKDGIKEVEPNKEREKRSESEIKGELKIKEAELKLLEDKQSKLNAQLEKNLKENQLDLLQGAKPQSMFDDKVEQQKVAESLKNDIDKKRKEVAKLQDELDNINQEEIPFQSTDKKFTTITEDAFTKLLDKLKKAFPNVKVELFGKGNMESAKKALEKYGVDLDLQSIYNIIGLSVLATSSTSQINQQPLITNAVSDNLNLSDGNVVEINDNRLIDKASGNKITDKNKMSASVTEGDIKKLTLLSNKHGVDPYTMIAMTMQETNFDTGLENPFHYDPQNWEKYKGISEDPMEIAVLVFKDKLKYAERLGKKTEAEKIQAYNGYGKIGKKTDAQKGSSVRSWYGISSSSFPIDMNKTPIYGNRVLDIRDNIIKSNPKIVKLVESQSNNIAFLKTKDGTIYGFKTPDGKVFINTDNLNANTPIHEFGHIWQSVFPQEFARGIELLKLSPQGQALIREIQKNPAYKGKSLAEIQAEALVTAIGNKGEAIFNSNPTLFNKFKEWLSDFFKKLGDKLGIKDLSADDKLNAFTKKVTGELLGGKVLSKEVGNTKEKSIKFQGNNYETTTAFDRWKGKNKLVSGADIQDIKSGEPVVVRGYHGTTNDFYVFDSSVKGNIEGHLGKVNYFTSDEQDAAGNYQSDGADLTGRIDRRQEEIESTLEYEYSDDKGNIIISKVKDDFGITTKQLKDLYPSGVPKDIKANELSRFIAEKELKGGTEKVLDVYIKLNNPVVLGNKSTWFDAMNISESDMNDAVKEIAEEYDVSEEEAKSDYAMEIQDRAIENTGYEKIHIEALTYALNVNGYDGNKASEILGDDYYETEIDLNALEKKLRKSELYENDNGEIASSQVIADFFKNLGYDGIILNDVSERFKNMGIGGGTSHIHVFDEFSNQIKLADGTNTTFNPESNDIRFQIVNNPSKEEIGKAYDKAQQYLETTDFNFDTDQRDAFIEEIKNNPALKAMFTTSQLEKIYEAQPLSAVDKIKIKYKLLVYNLKANNSANKASFKQQQKQMVADITALIKGNLGGITGKQAERLTNLATTAVEKNSTVRLGKIINQIANLADQRTYQKAKTLYEVIKARSKRKGGVQSGKLTGVLQDFATINPLDVSDIAKYVELAEKVKQASNVVKQPTDADSDLVYDEVQAYVKAQQDEINSNAINDTLEDDAMTFFTVLDNKTKAKFGDDKTFDDLNEVQQREVFESITKDDIKKYGLTDEERDMVEAFKEIKTEQKRQDFITATYVKIGELKDLLANSVGVITQSPAEKEITDALLNVKLDDMTATEMARVLKLINGITQNNDYSGGGAFVAQQKSVEVNSKMNTLKSEIGEFRKLSEGGSKFRNFQQISVAMAKGKKLGAKLMEASGINNLMRGIAKTKTYSHNLQKAFKAEKFKSSVFEPISQMRQSIYAAVIQTKIGDDVKEAEHIERWKRIIEKNIENLRTINKDGYKEQAELLQKALDEVIGDRQQLKDIADNMSKVDSEGKRVVQFFTDNHAEQKPRFRENSLLFHNKEIEEYNSYTKLSITSLTGDTVRDTGEKLMNDARSTGITKKKSKSMIDRANYESLNDNTGLDFNFINKQMKALGDNEYDINTSADITTLANAFNSDNKQLRELIGAENFDLLKKRLQTIVGTSKYEETTVVDDLLNEATKISRTIALGSITQVLKQSTVLMSTYLNSAGKGNIKGLDFTMLFGSKRQKENIQKLFAQSEIGARRAEGAGGYYDNTTIKKNISDGNAKKILKAIGKGKDFFSDLSMYPLRSFDILAADISWITFYKKYLRDNNLVFDENNEFKNPNKEAMAYAETMVQTAQGANTEAGQAEVWGSAKGLTQLALPFMLFAVQAKARLVDNVMNIYNGDDRVEAGRDIGAYVTEQIAFNAVKLGIGTVVVTQLIPALLKELGLGDDDEEKGLSKVEKEKIELEKLRKAEQIKSSFINNIVQDLTYGTIPMVDNMATKPAINFLYNHIFKTNTGIIPDYNRNTDFNILSGGTVGVGYNQLLNLKDDINIITDNNAFGDYKSQSQVSVFTYNGKDYTIVHNGRYTRRDMFFNNVKGRMDVSNSSVPADILKAFVENPSDFKLKEELRKTGGSQDGDLQLNLTDKQKTYAKIMLMADLLTFYGINETVFNQINNKVRSEMKKQIIKK